MLLTYFLHHSTPLFKESKKNMDAMEKHVEKDHEGEEN
jgi:hypothetical protein